MGLFSWLNGKANDEEKESQDPLLADMHSHLLPGIDDGSSSMEESITMLRKFEAMGFKKVITTPHILRGFYDNNPTIIREKRAEVQQAMEAQGINLQFEAAAEYYFDEHLVKDIVDGNELLTFGGNYILFETAFTTEPMNLKEMISEMRSKGLQPVFAHPERYDYMNTNWSKIEDYARTGVYFQVNALSLEGYYNAPAQKMAERLIEAQMIQFIGSDCHKPKHADLYKKVMANKFYKKALEIPLINRHL